VEGSTEDHLREDEGNDYNGLLAGRKSTWGSERPNQSFEGESCAALLELYKRKIRLVAPVCAVGVFHHAWDFAQAFELQGAGGTCRMGRHLITVCLTETLQKRMWLLKEDVTQLVRMYSTSWYGPLRPRKGEISTVEGTPYE
jgi:hypothetical protein